MSKLNQVIFDTKEGLPLGKGDISFTYLYGLSDFWSYLFEDFSAVNLLLETKSLSESEIYSNFLQLSSGISIDQIQILSSSQVKLLVISSNYLVQGTVSTYKLPFKVSSCSYLANRVILPTITLSEGSEFSIDITNNTITFSKSLSDFKFPSRLLSDGTREFALWMVDVQIDEGWIHKFYGKLIQVPNPTLATEQYKSFIYGMYYLYCHGPNLGLFKKGLNLALGIPLARDSETVLEIRQYLNTNDYVVITDLNSYVIPYGLIPTVNTGDILEVNQELASWVELKDYVNDGVWWINLKIPPTIMPLSSGYAIEGSDTDWIMRNYLKTHTFLVNVKTTNFKNIEQFTDLFSVIQEVKPKNTTPIYIWTISIEDSVGLVEDLVIDPSIGFEDTLGLKDLIFERDSPRPYLRGPRSYFSRLSVPAWVEDFVGTSPNISNLNFSFRDSPLTGFVTPQLQYRTLTDKEQAWVRVLARKDNHQYCIKRSVANFSKRISPALDGVGYDPLTEAFPNKRVVFLYLTLKSEIDKFSTYGLTKAVVLDNYINKYTSSSLSVLTTNFTNLFTRLTSISTLGLYTEGMSTDTYTIQSSDLINGDYICTTFVTNELVGVYVVTSNLNMRTAPFRVIPSADPLSVKISGMLDMSTGTQMNPLKILGGAKLASGTTFSNADNTSFPVDFSGATFNEKKICN